MNKNKFYIVTISALLLINLLLVGFHFIPKKGFHPPQPKHIVIEKLNFDENQTKKYKALIKIHMKQIHEKDEAIKRLKNKLFERLKVDRNKQIEDSLMLEINYLQNEVEHIHYNHFVDIKKICKEDQLENYNELVEHIGHIFGPKPPMRP